MIYLAKFVSQSMDLRLSMPQVRNSLTHLLLLTEAATRQLAAGGEGCGPPSVVVAAEAADWALLQW